MARDLTPAIRDFCPAPLPSIILRQFTLAKLVFFPQMKKYPFLLNLVYTFLYKLQPLYLDLV